MTNFLRAALLVLPLVFTPAMTIAAMQACGDCCSCCQSHTCCESCGDDCCCK